jgi:hypothetical protein
MNPTINRGVPVKSTPVLSVAATLSFILITTFATSCARITASPDSPRARIDERPLRFREIAIADGHTEDGFRTVEYHFKASDCVRLSNETIFYGSPEQALNQVRTAASAASEVLDRGLARDQQGNIVGERVVLHMRPAGQQAYSLIALNNGANFERIVSASTRHVLDYEKTALDATAQQSNEQAISIAAVAFAPLSTTQGQSDQGIPYSETVFQSSDCEILITRTENYLTPDLVQRAIADRLKNAVEILEDGPKPAANQSSGRRVVAMFKADSKADYIEKTVLLWTDGNKLKSIEGVYTYVMELASRVSRERN